MGEAARRPLSSQKLCWGGIPIYYITHYNKEFRGNQCLNLRKVDTYCNILVKNLNKGKQMVDAAISESLLALAKLLGFTDIWSTIWNIIAYATAIAVVRAIRLDDQLRNVVMTVCAPILALYAGVFLGNPVFMSLQILIGISGTLVWAKMPPPLPKLLTLLFTAGAYALLFKLGAVKFSIKSLDDFLIFAGPLGLVCIALALATFPKNSGFLLFAVGGAFLTGYALASKAWVFFILNIIFSLVSARDYVIKTSALISAGTKNSNSWHAQKLNRQ